MTPLRWLLLGLGLLIVAAALFVLTGGFMMASEPVPVSATLHGPVAASAPETPITAYAAAVTAILGTLSTLVSAVTKLILVIKKRAKERG